MKKNSETGEAHRLELLIFDDILKDNILTSEKERDKLKQWYYGSVIPATNPQHNCKRVIGTPMTASDLLEDFKKSKTYRTVMLPIAKEFPVAYDKLIPAWAGFHSKAVIKETYEESIEMGVEDVWMREKMLQVVNDKMRVFKKSNHKTFNYEQLKKKFSQMNFFTTIDLASSKKDISAYSCVMTIGVDEDNNRFVVANKTSRMNPREVIIELFDQVRKFNPIMVKAEKAALQQVLNHFIEEEMIKTNIFFNVEELGNNSEISKHNRILGTQPYHSRGMVYQTDKPNESDDELYNEMYGYLRTGATTEQIDALDALSNFNDPDFIVLPMPRGGSEITEEFDYEEEFVDTYDF